MNIGNRVRSLRLSKNLKIAELADAVGVDAANISRLETGKQKQFTEQSLTRIAQALGVKVIDLFTSGEIDTTVYKNSNDALASTEGKDVFRVEVLDVSASAGSGHIQGSDIIDVIHAIEYSNDQALTMFGGRSSSGVKVINVRGDSMSPTIEPGDLLFVDVSINEFDGDGIYTFGFDGKIYVKRLQMIPDQLLVISDNPKYREWSISKENEYRFYIYGKVLISQSQSFKRHG
ncbi:helix-turn-helix transcriptional regulator [Citrobacter freundii]|mgnify:CR=1 FL=1|jgi:phage repressor protein C with HTH and peptisase S24 domain|uniref:XRE family transcriptional regulator n=1 Tax=Enterobacteriaceae TaxID=543 RepID=UPI000A3A45D3|nr:MULTISPECIES: helix-turn-helix transcriptional regulator [Enterobacteriaceae]EBS3030313.1 helix-turn-helix transcriptional regulator [Salmonella enterica subsp. enterica serovar Saintpaul]EBW8678340.1 helix-turn-helix transcriptional regulator [Salmonella enterica subsp. enterica serovar Waycross]ECD1676341.1 helix-turn-helix transcriptional regulator [Salmonella enterica subsp. enterica serovar Herston]ECM8074751.1 helix-turn-helix transcriptional regulator [Salmonella enterica subsp. enter